MYHWGVIKSGGGTLTKIILIIFSIGTAGYTAVLLGVLKAIPFWHQTSLPILFIISATSTGISITIIVQKIFLQDEVDLKKVESGHFYLLVLEIFLLMGFILISFSGVPEMVYSVKSLLFGLYSLYFWLFLLLLGLIIPTIVFGLLEFKNFHFGNKTIILVEFLVVMGGFFLRYLIIHAGVFTEKFISYIGG